MKYIIFSIDNHTNENHRRVMSVQERENTGNVVPCMGMWQGVIEHSYIMNSADFNRYIRGTDLVANQDCFMYVSECNKQYCHLEWADGYREGMGNMTQVSRDEAMKAPGYTYRPDLDIYWVAKEGNPDRIGGVNLNPASVSIHQLDRVAAE